MALINKLEAIGDAVRAKTGDTDKLTLDEMVTKIQGIASGPTASDLTITGNCDNRFAYGGWDWVIEKYGDQITTDNIQACNYMFRQSRVSKIPFTINIKATTQAMTMDGLFLDCINLTELPYVINSYPSSLQMSFRGLQELKQVPEDYFDSWNWDKIKNMTTEWGGYINELFSSCYKLRKVPLNWLNNMNPNININFIYFRNGFSECKELDELQGLPVPYTATWTQNGFSNFCIRCHRLKNITFAPTGAKSWKSQTIDFSNSTGWGVASIAGKQVIDDATYAALKNDPDWWTSDVAYSRYNHDSAVATINSLPDTSAYLATAGGTNTIKFKGAAGEKTDGGAINTLTAEEIAVAAAKGWTVTLV